MDEAGRIEVIIADDNAMVLSQMRALLSLEKDIIIVGQARNGFEVVKLAGEHTPDVVLMDLKMSHMDGFEAVRQLKEAQPGMRIVVLTMYDNEDYKQKALSLGADAYLIKGRPMQEILDTIKKNVSKNL